MALALSNQMRQYAFMPEFVQKVDNYWTVDWFARMIMDDRDESDSALRIGSSTMRGSR